MTVVGESVDHVWSRLLFAWCWLAAAARDVGRWTLGRLQTPGWQHQRAPAHGLVEIAILIGVVAVATLGFAKLVIPAIMAAGDRAIQPLNGSGTGRPALGRKPRAGAFVTNIDPDILVRFGWLTLARA